MLFFGVPILQSEDAPTHERETVWVQQRGEGEMGTWPVFSVPMSLLHIWDLLSFPALGIAEEKLQLILVNAIVIPGLFSKYNLTRKKGASGSF